MPPQVWRLFLTTCNLTGIVGGTSVHYLPCVLLMSRLPMHYGPCGPQKALARSHAIYYMTFWRIITLAPWCFFCPHYPHHVSVIKTLLALSFKNSFLPTFSWHVHDPGVGGCGHHFVSLLLNQSIFSHSTGLNWLNMDPFGSGVWALLATVSPSLPTCGCPKQSLPIILSTH